MSKQFVYAILAVLLLTGLASQPSQADVRLPEVFTDGLCLQRDKSVPVWGTADAGEKVTVTIAGQSLSAVAAADGKWRVDLASMKAAGPIKMEVIGKNTISFPNVYVGDVWLCYGQSNMQWEINRSTTAAEAASESTPDIRLLHVHRPWAAAAGDALQNFSAVGYYFGRSLHTQLHVPIGLIYGGEGGTPAETWTPSYKLAQLGYTGPAAKNIFYTDRVLPLEPYAIKGCIWYQGENNAGHADVYTDLMQGLIEGWRHDFQQGDFPFLFIQLARIGAPINPPAAVPTDAWALLREAQVQTLRVPNTGMVVIYDLSNGNIHPPYKQPFGERMALLARTNVYGEKPAYRFTCPLLDSVDRKGNTAVLHLKYADDGLMLQNGTVADNGTVTFAPAQAINDLFLARSDGSIVPAKARLTGSTVAIDLTGETTLPDVYYAWSSYPVGNIYNKAGLPLSPFRLVGLQMYGDQLSGNTVSLIANQRLDPLIATKPASYIVAGAKVLKAELINNGMGVRLTTSRAWPQGSTATMTLAGFTSWDHQSRLADISLTALPGKLASGGLIREYLIGETRRDIDPAKILSDPSLDITTFVPVVGPAWKLTTSDDGVIDLIKAVGNYENAVTFAFTNVYSDSDRTVQLWLGSDDGVKAYVNGKAVWTADKMRGVVPDTDKVPNIHLNKGWNTLLLEVSQGGGGWGVAARIVGADGHPATGVSYAAVKPQP